MATNPKKMFNNLVAGDVISVIGMGSQFIVLKTRGVRGELKHLGQICGCGKHVHGIPYLFQWSDEKHMPVDKDDHVLEIWHGVQVDKEVSVALAEKFAGLAVNDDHPNNEEVLLTFEKNPNFLKAVETGHYSNAGLGVTVVAMIRTLGGTLSDEQATLIAATVGTHAKVSSSVHMASMSALLGTLSGVKR